MANSTSTMHKIHSKSFEMSDFSTDHMNEETIEFMGKNIEFLENLRVKYNDTNAVAMYYSRKNHKLDEWHTFCDWVTELPYFKELFIQE